MKNSRVSSIAPIFLFLIAHCTLIIDNCFSQWQPDVRLTYDPSISYTSLNNGWCIAASGNVVHVVWEDYRDGNSEIYYKRSTDSGINWNADTRLTNNSALSISPSVSVSAQAPALAVHVVWYDERDGNFEIYYKRSSDGGISWGADTRLTNNSAFSWYPSVAVSSSPPMDDVHIVWEDLRDGNLEIYYKRSTDRGVNWGADTRLTYNSAYSRLPSVAVSNQTTSLSIHIVWQDERDGNEEIYYKRSTDGGISWGADSRMTNNFYNSFLPSVTISDLVVQIVWSDYRDGNYEIYHKRSTNAGISWGADTRLTNNFANSWSPSVAVSGLPTTGGVHVVWYDEREGNDEIYYKRSTDGGINWNADTRLTNNTSISRSPSVAVSGSPPMADVHVIWNDERDGNREIYYKRDPTGNPIGINIIGTEIPKEFSLSQNYPNPFNPTTKIRFAISGTSVAQTFGTTGFSVLSVYDVLGREVAILVNEQLQAGTYEVEWPAPSGNASHLPSGLYFYRIISGNFTDVKKMLLIK